jgi:insertion element IS1 protein InsB
LILECDELWSFVGSKANKQWVWLAMDRGSREIVGVHVGSRDEAGAFKLWDSLPDCYTDATCFTDALPAYQAVIYGAKHHVGKGTQHIERFNCTLRHRVSRLVRKSLAFSKKLVNHVGAIWLFVHEYNSSLRVS